MHSNDSRAMRLAKAKEIANIVSSIQEGVLSRSAGRKATQAELAEWGSMVGTSSQSTLSRTLKTIHQDSGGNPPKLKTLQDLLESLQRVEAALRTYEGELKDFSKHLGNKKKRNSIRALLVVAAAVLIAVAAFLLWAKQGHNKNEEAEDVYTIHISAEGYKTSGGDTIPWHPVQDRHGSPLYLNRNDRVSFIVGRKNRILLSKDTLYIYDVFGTMYSKPSAEVYTQKIQEKQIARAKYKLAGEANSGALVFHLDRDDFTDDKDFFDKRRIAQNKPRPVGNSINDPFVVEESGFLYLAVNDYYLFRDEMDELRVKRDSLERPWKDALKAYSAYNCNWFYEDNKGEFDLKIRVFRALR